MSNGKVTNKKQIVVEKGTLQALATGLIAMGATTLFNSGDLFSLLKNLGMVAAGLGIIYAREHWKLNSRWKVN